MRRALAVVTAVVAAGAFGLLAVATVGVATDAWRIVPVRSGSMEPSIPTGAAAFARPVDVDDLDVGDVVVFHPPTQVDVLLVHRIAEVEVVDGERVFRTRGDANGADDPWLVSFEDAELWRVERVVPFAGRLQASMSGSAARMILLVLGGVLVLGVGLSAIWRRRDGADDRDDRSGDEPPEGDEVLVDPRDVPPPSWQPAPARRSRTRTRSGIGARVGAVVALVVAVGLVPTDSALGAFSASTQTSGGYSTGTLHAPNPVSCEWGDFLAVNNQVVWIGWNDTSPGFATAFQTWRSTTPGGPYTLQGTTAAGGWPLSVNSFSPRTQIHYYVVRAIKNTWFGPYSNEIASNQCRNSVNAYAGALPPGFSGDGGPATSAQFNEPVGVDFDAAGNAFVADATNNRIRRIDATTGVVTTFAGGTGAASACSYSGHVSGLRMSIPFGVAVDSANNVYVADTGANCVRRIAAGTGAVSRVAGGGGVTACTGSGPAVALSLNIPTGLAFDASDNLYIADTGNNCVRRVTGTTRFHVAGGGATSSCTSSGAATSVALALPVGLAIGPDGSVYLTDAGNNCVRRVQGANYSHVLGGGATTSCWGSGAATTAALNLPLGVAVDATGRVYVSDSDHRCVRRVSAGNFTGWGFDGTLGAGGNNGPVLHAQAAQPAGLAFAPNGDLAIVDRVAGQVRRVVTPT